MPMRPLLPIVISYICGIAACRALKPTYGTAFILFIMALSFLLIGRMRKWRPSAPLFSPAFFLLGVLFLMPYVRPEIAPGHIKNLIAEGPLRLDGRVYAPPESKLQATTLYVETTAVFKNNERRPAVGKILLETESPPASIKRGDLIRFLSDLKEVRNFSNPGEFDYRWRLLTEGILVRGHVKKGLMVKIGEDGSFFRHTDRARRTIGDFMDSLHLKHPSIIKALIIGERGEMAPELNEAFRRTGTAHILSISGLHVGFVAFFSYLAFLWILKKSEWVVLRFNVKKTALFMSMAPVGFYGLISGMGISTQRALVMAGAFIVAMLIGRIRDIYTTIALAALIVLLISPASLWDPAFQLSFAAVISIVYLSPRIGHDIESFSTPSVKTPPKRSVAFLGRVREKIKMSFLVTASATIGTYPIVAYHFHTISFSAFIANLIVVPISAIIIPLGFVSTALIPVSHALAGFFFNAADILVGLMVLAVGFFSSLPYSSAWVSRPTLIETALFYAMLFCARNIKDPRGMKGMAVIIAIFLAHYGYGYYKVNFKKDLSVTFISVGQGDSALLEVPAKGDNPAKRALIDGGGFWSKDFDTGKGIIAPLLWAKKIKQVDYLILSHAQRDHMDGLKFIAQNFKPKEFWWNGVGELSKELADIITAQGVKVFIVNGKTPKRVINGVEFEFVHPDGGKYPDMNEESLVVRVSYGKRSFLFTGDIGAKGEMELIDKAVKADVLKVPHHGSRFSSSPAFLDNLSPSIAIVSAGYKNPFSMPSPEVIRRYEERGIRLLRTDLDGAITASTDGERLDVDGYLTGE